MSQTIQIEPYEAALNMKEWLQLSLKKLFPLFNPIIIKIYNQSVFKAKVSELL